MATILSQFVSAGLCLLQLTCTRQSWRIQLRRIRFYRPVLGQILRFGLPAGLQNSIISFANVVVQSNINAFGEMAMAGCGAYSKIEGFGFLPITSFAMALTTFVGQNLGAGEYERVKKGARFGVLSAVVLAELIGAVVFLFAPALIAAFDSTPEVVRFGVEKSRTAGLFFFLLAYSHSWPPFCAVPAKRSFPWWSCWYSGASCGSRFSPFPSPLPRVSRWCTGSIL